MTRADNSITNTTLNILQANSESADFSAKLSALKTLPVADERQVIDTVREVLSHVRHEGDAALIRYTQKWDGVDVAHVQALEISSSDCATAWQTLDADLKVSLQIAHDRIRRYHEAQKPIALPYTVHLHEDGGDLRYRQQPLSRVALYVPGGKASYPSSVLMNAIPAKVAGVHELIMITPTPQGQRNTAVLACAHLCDINRVFAIGGAQAVGAVAFGTETIPRCDKIVGPGNAWVAEAKRQVFGQMGIDMVAGPSEVLIISDGSGHPSWVAADLMAQAEHDPWAQSILLCTSEAFIQQVLTAINQAIPTLSRRETIIQSLNGRGALIHVPSLERAINICNELAPEHVMLALDHPEPWVEKVRYAGGIFCGHNSCEVLGDYCAGTNHVLPTFGSARFFSPLSVHDFLKGTSILNLSRATVQGIAPHAERMALSEGLTAHALAASLRK